MICYLINLERTPERLAHFMAQVEGHNLEVARVEAVDGLALSAAEIRQWQERSTVWSPLSSAEIGCFLSHREAWSMVVERGEPWAFIAEDDIHLSDDFGDFLNNADWLPADAALVKAETSFARIEMSMKGCRKARMHRMCRLASDHTGSGGYFVSRTGAEVLLRLADTVCEPVDRFLFSPDLPAAQALRPYQLDPALCTQDCYLTAQGLGLGLKGNIPWGGDGPATATREPKRTGTAKLRHEVLRPLLQLAALRRRLCRGAFRKSITKAVRIRIGGKLLSGKRRSTGLVARCRSLIMITNTAV
jgi:glycosyl transferase, family 25